VSAHRVSSVLSDGDIADGVLVLHKCDFKPCVRPSHLHRGDTRQNAMEAVERGLIGGPRPDWDRDSCGSGDEWTGSAGAMTFTSMHSCHGCDGSGIAIERPPSEKELRLRESVYGYMGPEIVCVFCGGTGIGALSLRDIEVTP